MIETIDSEKLANKVDKAWEAVDKPNKLPLNVMLQINTSHENGRLEHSCISTFLKISSSIRWNATYGATLYMLIIWIDGSVDSSH